MHINHFRLVIYFACLIVNMEFQSAKCQDHPVTENRKKIDLMRDRDLQPEKIMDAIELRPGMIVGEAGAGNGYFTFKMGKRVGKKGFVFANDIDTNALQLIKDKCVIEKITNIKTVLGTVDDPLYPKKDLDMVVVFDCLFEFSKIETWLQQTKKYLKPEGRLVIVDPDPSKILKSEHFLSRKLVYEFARNTGYNLIEVDDSFLISHM